MIELRQEHPLEGLLKLAGLARSTFYYQQKVQQSVDKYAVLKSRICSIFDEHKGRYGYRRITAAVRRAGHLVNHKTVQRLMGELQLKSRVRIKKYRAYRGEEGQVAPNLLKRKFDAKRPNQKWVTDVTEFRVGGQKLYLSPILDLYNGEIIAFKTARRPLFDMVGAMLRQAFERLRPRDKPILHSDQGWQYRMPIYRRVLNERAVKPSMSRKGNCYDNAAITSFFDEIDHEWMLMLLGHRIADRPLLGLICKWLQAGIMEEGRRVAATKGSPQGAVISPVLANIYLHYVLDLWAGQWRERHARGDVIVVRYADDSVVGFRLKSQAQQFLQQLRERLARFGLSLNASKTRLIQFGRFAARNRRDRGLGKPETFDFLGFTHCCSTNRIGGFQILRLTVKKRMRATLLVIRDELKRRRHEPIRVQGQWLNRVVSGYFNYHAVPGNLIRLGGFRLAVCRLWRQALKRRSQRNRLQWSRYGRLADLYIPRPRNAHPYPEDRFASRTQGRSRMR